MAPSKDPGQLYEICPDPQSLTSNTADPSQNSSTGVDYEPNPSNSIKVNQKYDEIVKAICRLYSGSASEQDMQVYAEKAIYDDPWSYCDTRYKIAGQWWGIPKIMASSRTLKTEIVSFTPPSEKAEAGGGGGKIIFKLQQEYTPAVLHFSKVVNSLVTLSLDQDGKVKYHKDMWNEKDYSHEGLGKILKTLNGDYLTMITRPPDSL